MEIATRITFFDRMKNLAFKEKSYFLSRREINWGSLGKCASLALGLGIIGILLIPAPKETFHSFTEQAQPGEKPHLQTSDPTQETIQQLSRGSYSRTAPADLSHLYGSPSSSGSGSSGDLKNSSMILGRGGLDSRTQLPAGSRIAVRLIEKAIVSSQGMPIIGIVSRDYVHEGSVAVPQGSKVFGDISFENSGERASVTWRSIQFPDGRERPLSAIGVGSDGQVGVDGRVHSETMKNVIGQTMTRFIGAYAEGSMQRGSLGENPGGAENGLKNAISETAHDQAERWADDLKKEKRWIEISNRTEFFAVLTANFAFRDPGATYGQ
ncbi:MAG: TrbI/VirB10 family protein [Bdellovibrionaceae bacterium]|nr:TrbI/VirB10 family protein [Pseudobdellovibrionaceae bacterium]